MGTINRTFGKKTICKLKFFPGKSFYLIESNPPKSLEVSDIDISRFEALRLEKEYYKIQISKGTVLVLLLKLMLNNIPAVARL